MRNNPSIAGIFLAAGILVLTALPSPTVADTGTEDEISHLLQYISQSECLFIRNGKEHGSVEALEHIRKKYDYVRKRVRKAEDFIEYAATKSSITGRPYLVRCGEEELPTADWLTSELARFRRGESPIDNPPAVD